MEKLFLYNEQNQKHQQTGRGWKTFHAAVTAQGKQSPFNRLNSVSWSKQVILNLLLFDPLSAMLVDGCKSLGKTKRIRWKVI